MSIQDLAQTHCNTMQHATQQLEHPRLDTTSPKEERTARPAVRRARRGARGRGPGKRLSMRDAFVDGSTLLREAARLARFDGMSLDLCFWDPGCSSWVGVEPRPSGVISRSIREFEDGRARFQKSLRSLHNRLAKYVEAYGVPCRFKCFDPFKEQWLVTIGAPAGWLMDSQDWKRACESRLPYEARWEARRDREVADPISTSSQGVARKGEREGERKGGREREKEETPLILTGDSTSRSM
ncbi:hypothetical protein Focb16_v004210 [Fusarium oxysporum f. sp. cubense]|uniref:Uncharacterized protein n=1 Tax=Fusarium oxysporum f. sp. cubense TaxID=61366 RepID=A0A559KRU5_FUSOC|nr:hypothetical protein Focb16_v004210 [Fusarium oxysporum f. sp. cubense]